MNVIYCPQKHVEFGYWATPQEESENFMQDLELLKQQAPVDLSASNYPPNLSFFHWEMIGLVVNLWLGL